MRVFFIVFPILALIGLVVFHGVWARHFPFDDAGIWLHQLAGALLGLFFSLGLRFSFFSSAAWIILLAIGWEMFELVYYADRSGCKIIAEALGSWQDILGTVIPGITILLLFTIYKKSEDDNNQSQN